MADLTGWQVLAFTVAVAGGVCLAMIDTDAAMFCGFCALSYGVAREVMHHA